MDSPREQSRFGETMAHLSSMDAPFDKILELGCGEGHQSLHLKTICTELFGVDISDIAIRRARARCPSGQFSAMPLEQIESAFDGQHFDLITACEVLYYAVDITCRVPDDYIDPRRTALIMARSILREVCDWVRAC